MFFHRVFSALCLFVFFQSAIAQADLSTETSVATEGERTLSKRLKIAYSGWLQGPNSQALDGNKDGKGKNMTVLHKATLGYKFTEDNSLSINPMVNQNINNDPNSKTWEQYDPYLEYVHNKIFHSDAKGTDLSGSIRYYVPASETTIGANDYKSGHGGGQFRAFLNPTKTYLDGNLTLSGQVVGAYYISTHSSAERELNDGNYDVQDFWYAFDPSVNYQLTPKVALNWEWFFGRIRHTTNGKWTSLGAKDSDGQWTSLGVVYDPNKKLEFNPYLSWGADFRGLYNTDIGLVASYSFL